MVKGFIDWLFSFPSPQEDECLRFLRALASRDKPHKVSFSQYCFRCYSELNFADVNVRLDYDSLRQEWKLDVRDNRTCDALYGYYCTFSGPSRAQIDFLCETYGIWGRFSAMIEKKNTKDQEDRRKTEELRRRYLKGEA